MDSQSGQADDGRIEELERRLDRIEDRQSAVERSRAAMNVLLPSETRKHLRAASRENLLAVRSLLDYWINHLRDDSKAKAADDDGRENIPID
jgi:hypothetical protein